MPLPFRFRDDSDDSFRHFIIFMMSFSIFALPPAISRHYRRRQILAIADISLPFRLAATPYAYADAAAITPFSPPLLLPLTFSIFITPAFFII
jgi:hypothetical protein